MNNINYFTNNKSKIFEIKECKHQRHSSKAHSHNELSIVLIEEGYTNAKFENITYTII